MRFGMFDVIRWHETMSDRDTLANALEQVEFADKLGIQDIWLGEHHFSRHGHSVRHLLFHGRSGGEDDAGADRHVDRDTALP